MAPRTATIIKSIGADQRSEERQANERNETEPCNPPPIRPAEEGFSLVIDGKTKSHYDNLGAASQAGLKLKRAFPVVQVLVLDAVEKTRILIELPEGAGPSTDAETPQS